MCLEPINFNGNQTSCRTCDECLQTRINGWISRALAESSVANHTLAVTLTYSQHPDGTEPLGALQFRYRDIQHWIGRIRTVYRDRAERDGKPAPQIRYLACGEQGSKGTQRIHWHIILFCSEDIRLVGDWSDLNGASLQQPPLEKRLHWSLWPHGFMMVQHPSERGIKYALKYVLKDQFSSAKSKGRPREARSLPFAASMFRMSKKPPIGQPFLADLMDDYEALGAVPPKLRFKIPGTDGYLYPTGKLREYVLGRCHDINKVAQANGRSPAAWTTLLKSVDTRGLNINKDLETLLYGTETPQFDAGGLEAHANSPEFKSLKDDIRSRQDGAQRTRRSVQAVSTCGGLSPCAACLAGKTDAELRATRTATAVNAYRFADRLGLETPYVNSNGELQLADGFEKEVRDARRKEGSLCPAIGCAFASDPRVVEAFRNYNAKISIGGPVTESTGRNAEGKGPAPHRRDRC